MTSCKTIEVLHLRTDWAGGEAGASWFYHAVGSGIFLDCVAIRQRGTILAYTNRGAENRANDNYTPDAGPGKEYGMHYEAGRYNWHGYDVPSMEEHMHQVGAAMIVYTAADFVAMGAGDGSNPRTEIVVRHAQRGSRETQSSRGSCLDDPRIDIPLRTGFNGSLPCRCKKYSGWVQITNCDDSG